MAAQHYFIYKSCFSNTFNNFFLLCPLQYNMIMNATELDGSRIFTLLSNTRYGTSCASANQYGNNENIL